MKFLPVTTLLVAFLGANLVNAVEYTLSGLMDPLQAGTNGGFGSFDGGVPGAGDGTGTISGTYDDATNLLSYTLTWENLTSDITNMHFHRGAPGVGGGVDLGVSPPWSSPQTGVDVAVTDAAEVNLLNGDWYLNIHTSNFNGGEIRGQVIVTRIPEPATCGMIGIAMLGMLSVRRRIR